VRVVFFLHDTNTLKTLKNTMCLNRLDDSSQLLQAKRDIVMIINSENAMELFDHVQRNLDCAFGTGRRFRLG
jgi:hypothetical protein